MRLALLLLALTAEPTEADRAAVAASPKAPQLVLSTLICMTRQDEQESLAAIKQEKENSKIAGVVDLLALKRLQDDVVQKRQMIRFYMGALKSARLKPLSCDGKEVEFFWSCVAGEGKFDPCKEGRVHVMREMLSTFENAAWKDLAENK